MKHLYTIRKSVFMSLFIMFITGQLFSQQNSVMLDLLHPTYPSEFVFIGNGYWNQTYNDANYTFFDSQIFSFSHLIEGAGSSYNGYVWNGFTVCNSGDNTNYNSQGWIGTHEWGCMAGGGIKTDAQGNVMTDENGDVMVEQGLPYLVGYWNYLMEPQWWHLYYAPFLNKPTHCFQILLDDDKEYEAVGVYVNNHPWTYYSNLYGSAPARPLNQTGDFFKLIIHGLNPDGSESGKSVVHFLAKFENGQLTQSAKWEWVNLSSLGEIGGFYCTMETTDVSQYGPNAPMYFCMDKLQVKIKGSSTIIPVTNIIDVPDKTVAGVPLTLSGKVIPENATYKTIEWSVAEAGTTGATITENILYTTGAGTTTIKATIENGIAEGENYTKEFDISVIESNDFVSVTNITDVPDKAVAGTPLTLTGTVIPENATYKTIKWSITAAGTTGAIIIENILHTTKEGVVTVKATIENGIAEGENYTKEFEISVTEDTGIAETDNYPSLQMYPNPTTGKLHVVWTLCATTIQNIEIFDVLGRTVATHALPEYALPTKITIDISHLEQGMYFIRIQTNNETITRKIIKQ